MTPKTDIEVLREALELDVLPGPWDYEVDGAGVATIKSVDPHYGYRSFLGDAEFYPWVPDAETIAFMAACSPDRITRILDQHAKAIKLLKDAYFVMDRRQHLQEGSMERIDAFLSELTTPSDK